ncbi:MAG TPA: VWA domain-containing protein [Gemmatales bacterium]|nr:VWA domain-containing protein [Gemmatales bacterium]
MLRRLFLLMLATLLSGLSVASAWADPPVRGKPVDLVICLDCSNSMDGLIDSAKRKLWDIVNDFGRAKPTPFLRVALYSYGNDTYTPSNGWVRQEVGLTTDLDKVSEKLFGLRTQGGTEYVARVSQAALRELDWSKDTGAFKVIFVCGNEPADQDPEVKLASLAETAARQNVTINTIYCGPRNHAEAAGWKFLAERAEGKFMAIEQDSAHVVIAAPQDKRLADLSSKLNSTYVFYGAERSSKMANQSVQDVNALGGGGRGGLSSAASRGIAKASGNYQMTDSDLVDRFQADPKLDFSKLPDNELSDDFKKLSPEERKRHVEKKLAEREEIKKEINQLSKDRAEYLSAEQKKQNKKGEATLDEAVRGVIREQSAKKGIDIPK